MDRPEGRRRASQTTSQHHATARNDERPAVFVEQMAIRAGRLGLSTARSTGHLKDRLVRERFRSGGAHPRTGPEPQMPEPENAIAATFVEPRGAIRSIVASVVGREVLGAVGAATASGIASGSADDTSPLHKGQIAHLSVSADEIVLGRAKRGAFRPKPTDDAIASAPRASVRSAKVEKGRIAGVLEISFADGSSWRFDVPKVHLEGARQIAAALGDA